MFSYPRKSAQKYEIILIFATAHKNILEMKRLIITVFSLIIVSVSLSAQSELNAHADNIIGVYDVNHHGEATKVSVFKENNGTYTAQVCWVENRLDENGNVRLDEQNPDESLRNVECDKIVIIKGLVYNPDKQKWGGTKVYDPTRGFRASVQCEFMEDGRLRVKGTLLCFSQSIYWKKVQ